MQLILPKTLVPDGEILRPLFFLAGPIKGGGNWQQTACDLIASKMDPVAIAAPRRWTAEHPMHTHRAPGQEEAFTRQTLWERHYLDRAADWGCVLFWLLNESKSEPRQDGQPYGRDTTGELSAWRIKLLHNPSLKVVVGAEPDFPGLSVLTCNLYEDLGYDFPIYSTLEETVDAAIAMANQEPRTLLAPQGEIKVGMMEDPHYRRDMIAQFGAEKAAKYFEAGDLIDSLLARGVPVRDIQELLQGDLVDWQLKALHALSETIGNKARA
ncbi:MAG TPA: hypothetical protein VLA04_00740 [Verrucomicrobiae bacterium]|nr:hypothetical protein [Verrucomicrobiae bacterium]